MTVEAPLSGGFTVYDGKGNVMSFSKASNNYSAVLPEGGMMVFGGNAGLLELISKISRLAAPKAYWTRPKAFN